MESMKARAVLVVTVVIGSLLGVYGTAEADADHQVTVSVAGTPATWEGEPALGTNQDYNETTGQPCPDTPAEDGSNYCEQALLQVTAESTVAVQVSLDDDASNDFDFYIYESDASGTLGTLVDSSANPQTVLEVADIPAAAPGSYWLIQVVYFQTLPVVGYSAQAEILGEGGGPPPPPGPDFGETTYFLHEDEPPPPPADPGTYNTVEPTNADPAVASDSSGSPEQPQWEGDIGTAGSPGMVRRLKVDFWQAAPVSNALANVDYDVTLIVDGRRFEFPQFTAPIEPDVPGPQRVTHQFEPCTSTNPPTPVDCAPLLPLALPGGPVTFEIAGHYIDSQSVFQIYYDSVDFKSNFVVNPPPRPGRSPIPPDVDVPPGIQESLASNPALGFKSHSEPHIAQSPLNPNILVAGSKQYNRDPDSLAEYEFKIGTYVSFNGGRTWRDLGQLDTNTCPADMRDNEGPDAWPNNVCYPGDNPNKEGPEENEVDPDIAEEYITSDPWIQFDDEGNAYIMVLDHPPFDQIGEGNGWGMTSHKWESVSPQDLQSGGQTWSHRRPINAYRDPLGQALILDDKNTMAMNNAGPDNEASPTNIMVACWGQSISPPVGGKQQIVCERSTDQGQTWPGEPEPVIDAEALVIGVHVIADTQDPEKFYLTWNQYATGGGAGDVGGDLTPETLEFAVSVDGGDNFVRGPSIDTFNGLPRQFPGQGFRNLTIPIMAVGPEGELYIVYAAYQEATDPETDEDNKEGDILFVKSTDGGVTWTAPENLTEESGPGVNVNADQFQPYIATNPSGQLNVVYFDRRLDVPAQGHVGNYYTDVFFERSNDEGESWSPETRLTHDATDPDYNAPVSPSGRFFGDYQGLVADNCVAIPFFNDTHRANDEFLDPGPTRDPEFDTGMPSSQYQEVVSWRVPNTAEFGGTGMPDLHPRKITIEKIPRRGRPNLLAANIQNLECIDAANVVVRFFDNGQQIGSDKVIPLILGGKAKSATVNWTPRSAGPHEITVVADPGGLIQETNESNNSFSRTYQVRR